MNRAWRSRSVTVDALYRLFGVFYPARLTTRAYLADQLRICGVRAEQIPRACLNELADDQLRKAKRSANFLREPWLVEMMQSVKLAADRVARILDRGSCDNEPESIGQILVRHGIKTASGARLLPANKTLEDQWADQLAEAKTADLSIGEDGLTADERGALAEAERNIAALRAAGRLTPEDEAEIAKWAPQRETRSAGEPEPSSKGGDSDTGESS